MTMPLDLLRVCGIMKASDDPDTKGVRKILKGVRVGVGVKLSRTPAVFPRKKKYSLKQDQLRDDRPDWMDPVPGVKQVVHGNYESAKEHRKGVEKVLRDQASRGQVLILTKAQAEKRFGDKLIYACLGGSPQRGNWMKTKT